MIGFLAFLTVAATSVLSSLFILRLLKCNIWKIHLLLLSRFPHIPPIICHFCYYSACAYLTLPFLLVLFYMVYLGPFAFGQTAGEAIHQGLFIMRIYTIFVQHIYVNSIQWNVGKTYQALKWFNTLLFFSYQIIACTSLLDFESGSNAAFFLGLCSPLCLIFVSTRQTGRKISFENFCIEFMNTLEEITSPKPEASQLLESRPRQEQDRSSSMSSVPNERSEQDRESEKAADQNSAAERSRVAPLNLSLVNEQSLSGTHSPNAPRLVPATHVGFHLNARQVEIKGLEINDVNDEFNASSETIISKLISISFYDKCKKFVGMAIYLAALGTYSLVQ